MLQGRSIFGKSLSFVFNQKQSQDNQNNPHTSNTLSNMFKISYSLQEKITACTVSCHEYRRDFMR